MVTVQRARTINRTGFPLHDNSPRCAVDGNHLAVFQSFQYATHAHYGRQANFPSSDRAVRERAAAFGYDGGCLVEKRGPGGIGGTGYQNGALRKGREIIG